MDKKEEKILHTGDIESLDRCEYTPSYLQMFVILTQVEKLRDGFNK